MPKTWTDDDCASLRRLWLEGYSVEVIARRLERTMGAIEKKAKSMDLPGRFIRPARDHAQHYDFTGDDPEEL